MTLITIDIVFRCILGYTLIGILTIGLRVLHKETIFMPQQYIFNILCWPLVWIVLILAWAVDKIDGIFDGK